MKSVRFRDVCLVAICCVGIGTTPATAQSSAPGPYAVARAGVQLDADMRLRKGATTNLSSTDKTSAGSVLPGNLDAKPGFTGEMGMGYDFGGFRLEGTVGYDTAPLNGERLGNSSFAGGGRLKSLDFGIAGYADFNREGRIKPFIGGGIGASRTQLSVSRLSATARPSAPSTAPVPASRSGTRINDRDWGFRWHLDAGVGYSLTPATTLELSGRYTRTTSLDFRGTTLGASVGSAPAAVTIQSFKPRASSTSLMLGIRQSF